MRGAEAKHGNLIKANRQMRCTLDKADKVCHMFCLPELLLCFLNHSTAVTRLRMMCDGGRQVTNLTRAWPDFGCPA